MFAWAGRWSAVVLLLGLGAVGADPVGGSALLLVALLAALSLPHLVTALRPVVLARTVRARSAGWRGHGIRQLDPARPGRPRPRAPGAAIAEATG